MVRKIFGYKISEFIHFGHFSTVKHAFGVNLKFNRPGSGRLRDKHTLRVSHTPASAFLGVRTAWHVLIIVASVWFCSTYYVFLHQSFRHDT